MTAAPALRAAWCGAAAQADREPNVVAGNPIHWVYAIPSDGADNLAGLASVMQADAEQIDGWWRGQDPARTPRNDVAAFSCGAQLDITTVRLTRTSCAALAARGPLLGDRRRARRGRARLAAHEVRRLLRRRRRTTRTSAARVGATRPASALRSSTTAPAWACRRPPSRRTRCSTRSAPSRGARRTTATASRAGTRATTRPTSCSRRSAASLSPRRFSTPDATTTTVTPAAGRTRRTRRGSSASTARHRSR